MTIDPRMIRARSALITGHCFFGTLALFLRVEENEAIKTMATDGKSLIYAPSFLDRVTAEELKGVIAHEVLHCAFLHQTRRKEREPKRWNAACDFAINQDLIQAGFTLPSDALLDSQYRGMSSEEIYKRLEQSGDFSNAPEWGIVLDAAPNAAAGELGQQEEDWGRRVRQAIAVASGNNTGSIPASLQNLINSTKKAKVNWRDQLRRFIDDRSRYDHTWSKPNRRFLSQGYVFPGIEPDGLYKLGIVLDTSGSVDDDMVSQFLGEIEAAIDIGAADQAIVVQCDAKVQRVDRFQAGDEIKMPICGRGGTRFSPALEWFTENEPDVSALIYLSDGECSDFGPEPAYPTLWGIYGYESRTENFAKRVPFGEVVPILD